MSPLREWLTSFSEKQGVSEANSRYSPEGLLAKHSVFSGNDVVGLTLVHNLHFTTFIFCRGGLCVMRSEDCRPLDHLILRIMLGGSTVTGSNGDMRACGQESVTTIRESINLTRIGPASPLSSVLIREVVKGTFTPRK